MSATRIHQGKEARRRHYLAEWMELRGVKPADITEAIGADKSLISRWLNKGVLPGKNYLEALAGFLGAEEGAALFRHPDDDWLARFFRERNEADRARARAILEAAFPKRVA